MTQLDTSPYAGDPLKTRGQKPAHPAPTSRSDSARRALRQLARRVHFYAGLLIGPFLLIAALSGFLYALSPTIENVVYHDMTTASSPVQRVPLTEQVASAQHEFPALEVNSVISGEPGQNSRVLFDDPSLPSESYTRVVFVDPGTGAIDGESVQYGSGQALPIRTWLSEVHRRLHLGEPGRIYSELAASWLAPITLFGLYMWWDLRKRQGKPLLRRRPDERGKRPSTPSSIRAQHAIIGTWVAIGFLGLSATGLTWSTYAGDNFSTLRTALNWTTPTLDTSGANGDHADHGGSGTSMDHHMGPGDAAPMDHGAMREATIDEVDSAATGAGLSAPIQLTPPAEPGGVWTAAETRRSFTYGPDTVTVDAETGDVVDRLDFADYPVAAKLADWGIRAHMGFLFGIVNQLLLAAVAAALVVVVVRGYLMWWKRRPTQSGGGLPPMPEAGALWLLARSNPIVTALVVAAVAGVGFAVPLLGISLAAFILVDLAVQAVRLMRRRGSRRIRR